jgi:hypothetical protein
MVTDFTTWLAMSGNGAAIGIALITIRRFSTRAALRATRKAPTHHLILPSLARKNACIVVAHFFAMTNTAHATSLARAAKAMLTLVRIIWASVV